MEAKVVSWTGYQGNQIAVCIAPRTITAKVDGKTFGRSFEVLDKAIMIDGVEVVAKIGNVLLDRTQGEHILSILGEFGWGMHPKFSKADDEKLIVKHSKDLEPGEVVILTTKVVPPKKETK